MTNRRKPTNLTNKVLYFYGGRVVRTQKIGPEFSEVKHHNERFTIPTADLEIATKQECLDYLKPAVV